MTFEGTGLSDFRGKYFANCPRVKQFVRRVNNIICTPKKFAIILDHSQET